MCFGGDQKELQLNHNETPLPVPVRTAVISAKEKSKCRRRRGEIGTRVRRWWGRKVVQPPWETRES